MADALAVNHCLVGMFAGTFTILRCLLRSLIFPKVSAMAGCWAHSLISDREIEYPYRSFLQILIWVSALAAGAIRVDIPGASVECRRVVSGSPLGSSSLRFGNTRLRSFELVGPLRLWQSSLLPQSRWKPLSIHHYGLTASSTSKSLGKAMNLFHSPYAFFLRMMAFQSWRVISALHLMQNRSSLRVIVTSF